MADIQVLVSVVIRGFQFLWTIISLGLAAGILHDLEYNFERVTYTVVISVFTLIYLVMTLLPWTVRFFSPGPGVIAEAIMMVFWLASFAAITDTFAKMGCVYTLGFYERHTIKANWCYLGKALIAFTLFNWLMFLASLVLMVVFAVIPLARAEKAIFSQHFRLGAIFWQAPAQVAKDEEVGVGGVDGAGVATGAGAGVATGGIAAAGAGEAASDGSAHSTDLVEKVESPGTPTDELSH